MLSSMALIGQRLTPNPALATLPLALAPVATMIMTVPAAQLKQRRGRKIGFAHRCRVGRRRGRGGVSGCVPGQFRAALSGWVGHWCGQWLCHLLSLCGWRGGSRGFSQSRHFAGDGRGRHVAAISGSNLAAWSREWFPDYLFAGSFLGIAAVHALVLPVLCFVSFPAPSTEEQRAGGRSLREIARQADFALAVIGAVAAWGLMSLLMNATPLAMKRHLHSFADTAWVIQWHVLGMYVPSFFTGHLISRWGEHRIMFAGLALLGCSIAVNLSGIGLYHYTIGLALLGVGWNFLFVGSTSLLAMTHRPEEKARVQSCNDFLVFGLIVLTSFGAAPLEGMLGWDRLNHLAVPFLLAVAVTLGLLWARAGRSG